MATRSQADSSDFVNRFAYNVRAILERKLDELKDDLRSDDQRTRKGAEKMSAELCEWLFGPGQPLTAEQRLQQATEAANDPNLTPAERLAAMRRASRSTGRTRGRPRNESSQHAIEALSLCLGSELTWREIAYRLKQCNHRGRTERRQSCDSCMDSIRKAAERLERFLRKYAMHPEAIPRFRSRPN
jgi:hypothetical protein